MTTDMAAAFLIPMILLLAVLPFLFLTHAAFRRRDSSIRLPPSPWALPVIGHLHHLAGTLPHRAMRDLASRHGPLVLLRLGGLPVVVASSADAAREVMRSRDLDFASRPVTRMVRLAIPEGAEGIIFAPYGDAWRQTRKICTVELLNARRVQSFRPVREEETRRLLRVVASAPPEQAVNLSELLSAYAVDSSVRAIIGSRFRDRDAFLRLLEQGLKMFAKMSLPDLYPSSRLAMLVSRMPGRMKRHRQEVTTFLDAIVREHKESRAPSDGKEDLLDVLLRIQREGDLQFPLTTDNIKSVVGVSTRTPLEIYHVVFSMMYTMSI
jgi:cytochrome P450